MFFLIIVFLNSVFLKVELSCNGAMPVRILGSNVKPSTHYLVDGQSDVKQCDMVKFRKQT